MSACLYTHASARVRIHLVALSHVVVFASVSCLSTLDMVSDFVFMKMLRMEYYNLYFSIYFYNMLLFFS